MAKGIEIPIGMPLGQLVRDEKAAVASLKATEAQLNNTLSKTGTALKRSSGDFNKWNRVIQDSPYGIQGIANNLQELIPNIGLWSVALNVALTALTFLQVGTDNWTRGLKNNKKAVDGAKLSGDDYIKTLDQVAGAQLKGAEDAQKEVTTLELLYRQYQNANLPLKQRKEAYQQLQSLYPAYFGNIKFEQEASERTKKAYDELRTSIIATAKARAAADKITQNETRKLENEQKVADINKEILTLQNEVNKQQGRANAGKNQGFGGSQNQAVALQAVQAQAKLNDAIKLRNNLLTDSNILDERNLKLAEEINAQAAKGATLADIKVDTKKTKSKVFEELLLKIKRQKISEEITLDFAEARFDLANLKTPVQQQFESALKNITATIDPNVNFVNKILPTDALYSQGEIFKEYLQFDLLPQLGQNFEMFFNDILTKGKISFDALGKAVLSSFASVLASETTKSFLGLLGAKDKNGDTQKSGLFGAGILGKILPIAGIAAGAIGLLGGLFKKKQKPAEVPVPVQSNSIATSSVNSPVDIAGGRVVFEISGVNLVGVLNRAGYKLSRYGI